MEEAKEYDHGYCELFYTWNSNKVSLYNDIYEACSKKKVDLLTKFYCPQDECIENNLSDNKEECVFKVVERLVLDELRERGTKTKRYVDL